MVIFLDLGTFKRKAPFALVVVPKPLTFIAAPSIGSLSIFLTIPFMVVV